MQQHVELAADPVAAQLPVPQQQESPPDGEPRGYVRLAVMDGKTIPHRVCLKSFPVYNAAHTV